jgi:phytoene dehydrogenase-like protein
MDVHVLEASDGVGGRVRSDIVDGFTLDRGFQVILTAYPELKRQFDVTSLELRSFDPGALVWLDSKGYVVGDPLRQPLTLPSTLTAPIGTPLDKARIAALRLRTRRGKAADLLRGNDISTVHMLQGRGFSKRMIRSFFTPLVGGIQLDPQLTASRRMFDIIFRMLSDGDAAVPAGGMGRLSQQLADRIPPDRIHLQTPVVDVSSGSVSTQDGRSIRAQVVIVATEGPVASRLLGIDPVASRSAACVYFDAPKPPTDSKLIVLDGSGEGPVLNVAVMSNISSQYAPPGRHLVAAAIPGEAALDTGDLETAARQQLQIMFGPMVDSWIHLRTYRIEHGQPDQSPPFDPRQKVSLGEGIFVCGDHRDTASIQGALFSGRRCAEAVLARH